MEQLILRRNLAALRSRSPGVAHLVESAAPNPLVSFSRARSGDVVPLIAGSGRPRPIHSLYNPRIEAVKLCEGVGARGLLIFLGIGGGYHVVPYLSRQTTTLVLLVESEPTTLRSLLSGIDFVAVLSDPRVHVAVGAETLEKILLNSYLPALHGGYAIIPQTAEESAAPAAFTHLRETVEEAVQRASADFATQGRFGKRWFSNTLKNLDAAESGNTPLPRVRRAIVTAAGPSLEEQMPRLRSEQAGSFLIATDTSLSWLDSNGVCPDCVISIDCQHASYHHFLPGYPRELPLASDIASPPLLSKFASRRFFFRSRNPLAQYASQRWRHLPFVDTSGGNVTHAAVALASYLGAEEITLFGADFSYPGGKTYARGTYLYSHYASRADRARPVESWLTEFLFRSPSLSREETGSGFRYRTSLLTSYRDSLCSLIEGIDCGFTAVPGKGIPIGTKQQRTGDRGRAVNTGSKAHEETIQDTGNVVMMPWRRFLSDLEAGISGLPEPSVPVETYLSGLDPEQRALITCLYPIAASIRARNADEGADSVRPLILAGEWALRQLRSELGKDR